MIGPPDQSLRRWRTGYEALVIVGNDELHAAQAARCQGAQEVLPEG